MLGFGNAFGREEDDGDNAGGETVEKSLMKFTMQIFANIKWVRANLWLILKTI